MYLDEVSGIGQALFWDWLWGVKQFLVECAKRYDVESCLLGKQLQT